MNKTPIFKAEYRRLSNVDAPLFDNPATSNLWPVVLRPQVTRGLPFRRSCFVYTLVLYKKQTLV